MLDYVTFWNTLIILNAMLGLYCFEFAWKKFHRYRNPNLEVNAFFPAYRREDAIKWSKWKFYPGAMTIMLPRCLILFVCLIAVTICTKLLMLGHKTETPMTGVRKFLVAFFFKVLVYTFSIFAFFTWMTHRNFELKEVGNYEEYLGTLA